VQLTPEQQAQVNQAKAEGRQRILLAMTPEQAQNDAREVAVEEFGREENIRLARLRRQARNEPGFSGDLRRALASLHKPPQTIAAEIAADGELLDQFCRGEAELPTDVVDRLVAHLDLRLMRTIR
jgi:hypothetical protein